MSKNSLSLRLKATLATIAVAAMMLFGVAAPAQAAEVGGIDVAAYCKKNVKRGFPLISSKPVNTTNTW